MPIDQVGSEYSKKDIFKSISMMSNMRAITYLLLDKVTSPLTVKYGKEPEICIVDHGYSWMMFFPRHASYSLTVMINREYQVLQWYFDMIQSMELSSEGIPVINDMYLDFIVLPTGTLIVKDEDELHNAYTEGLIHEEDYKTALLKGEHLRDDITNGRIEFITNIGKYIEKLKKFSDGSMI